MNDLDNAQIIEPTPAPEIFVDGYASSTVIAGVAKFTFFSVQHDPRTNETSRRVVLRLSASLPVVGGVHRALGELLDQIMATSQPNGGAKEETLVGPN